MQNVHNSALSVLAFVVAAAIAVLVWQSSIAFVQVMNLYIPHICLFMEPYVYAHIGFCSGIDTI